MKEGRHICTECNAIYEEPDELLEPQKEPFENLPDTWLCKCGASKEMYQPCSCVSLEQPGQEDIDKSHCNRRV